MGEQTKIEWTDATFNPWRGCSKVHAGCANCYAETQSKRNPSVLGLWGPNGTRVVAAEKTWGEPLKWNKAAADAGVRRRVFCASLADVFELWDGPVFDHHGRELCVNDAGDWYPLGVPAELPNADDWGQRELTMDDLRKRLFWLIDATPSLNWLLVTKRPENVRRMWPGLLDPAPPNSPEWPGKLKHRPNVWLLTSVSDQPTADAMIPELLKCRDLVPVLGVSAEPLLGPVDFERINGECWHVLKGVRGLMGPDGEPDGENTAWLDWIIVGSESGHNRRPMQTDWALSLADQCRAANVAFFMKQMEIGGKITGNIADFPEKLMIREYPTL